MIYTDPERTEIIKLADNVLKTGIINIIATVVKQSNGWRQQPFKLKQKIFNKNDEISGIYITISKDLKCV